MIKRVGKIRFTQSDLQRLISTNKEYGDKEEFYYNGNKKDNMIYDSSDKKVGRFIDDSLTFNYDSSLYTWLCENSFIRSF